MENPLEYIQEEMKQYVVPQDELYRFPPFWGGLIGYLGYETVGYYESIEHLQEKEGLDIPDGILVIPQQLLVIDHLRRILWIITSINDIKHYEAACQSIDESWEKITRSIPDDMQVYNQYAALLDIGTGTGNANGNANENASGNANENANENASGEKASGLEWKSSLSQEEF